MNKKIITFEEFIIGVSNKQYDIGIINEKVPTMVSSDLMNKKDKRIYKLWLYLAPILIFMSLILFFIIWKLALVILILGIILLFGIKQSAIVLIRENMIKNKDFFYYALSVKGALLKTKDGHGLTYQNNQIIDYQF